MADPRARPRRLALVHQALTLRQQKAGLKRRRAGAAIARSRDRPSCSEGDRDGRERAFAGCQPGEGKQLPPPVPERECVPELRDVAGYGAMDDSSEASQPKGVRPERAHPPVELARLDGRDAPDVHQTHAAAQGGSEAYEVVTRRAHLVDAAALPERASQHPDHLGSSRLAGDKGTEARREIEEAVDYDQCARMELWMGCNELRRCVAGVRGADDHELRDPHSFRPQLPRQPSNRSEISRVAPILDPLPP